MGTLTVTDQRERELLYKGKLPPIVHWPRDARKKTRDQLHSGKMSTPGSFCPLLKAKLWKEKRHFRKGQLSNASLDCTINQV